MSLSSEELPEIRELTDAEWRVFQAIPDQGYSHRSWVDARIAERTAALRGEVERLQASSVAWTKVFPCETTYEQPYDFRQCETHDRTFPLDGTCDHAGVSEIDWLSDRESQQRFRAIRAEEDLELATEKIRGALGQHQPTSTEVFNEDWEPRRRDVCLTCSDSKDLEDCRPVFHPCQTYRLLAGEDK